MFSLEHLGGEEWVRKRSGVYGTYVTFPTAQQTYPTSNLPARNRIGELHRLRQVTKILQRVNSRGKTRVIILSLRI